MRDFTTTHKIKNDFCSNTGMQTATRNAAESWDWHILHIWMRHTDDIQILNTAFKDNEIQVVYTLKITETTSYFDSTFKSILLLYRNFFLQNIALFCLTFVSLLDR